MRLRDRAACAHRRLALGAMMAGLVGALLVGLAGGPGAAMANERIVSHPSHRLALFGYDPVAYFADDRAREGLERFELIYDDLVWRFANQGNYVAFRDDPQRFIPAYGGHGALMVARGSASPGQPQLFARLGQRVFFFRDAPSRYAFLLEAERMIELADQHWPEVRQKLAP